MSEKPILFNTEMVQAILEGRKTHTRRPIIFPKGCDEFYYDCDKGIIAFGTDNFTDSLIQIEDAEILKKFPYKVGDILYVRETWRIVGWHESSPFLIEYKDGVRQEDNGLEDEDMCQKLTIQCSEDCDRAGLKLNEDGVYEECNNKIPTRWRPNIHMPKWAARLWLKVTDVQPERLQDITEEGAKAEGVKMAMVDWNIYSYIQGFRETWNPIYIKRNLDWNSNPWVFDYAFERIER